MLQAQHGGKNDILLIYFVKGSVVILVNNLITISRGDEIIEIYIFAIFI